MGIGTQENRANSAYTQTLNTEAECMDMSAALHYTTLHYTASVAASETGIATFIQHAATAAAALQCAWSMLHDYTRTRTGL